MARMADHVVVHFDREPIETTLSGIFGGPHDSVRTFVPGPWEATVELSDGRRYLIPPGHHTALGELFGEDDEAVAAFAVAHGELLE